MASELRVATRTSPLARAQAGTIARLLGDLTGRSVRLVPVTSEGDRYRGPLTEAGGTGVFVAAVRAAVIDGEADVAVHSLKDLPTTPADGLTVAAIPRRADPRDGLVVAGLAVADRSEGGATPLRGRLADPDLLIPGARVGTGSPRRASQIRRLRPDVEVVGIRGNVGTRLERVRAGDLDAVVVAMAGLARLGWADRALPWDPELLLPAPGQGALAVEVGAGTATKDPDLARALAALDHGWTRAAVTAERALLAELEAGCSAPVGAWADEEPGGSEPILKLKAVAISVDGEHEVRMTETGPVREPELVGRTLAARMLDSGAGPAWWESSK